MDAPLNLASLSPPELMRIFQDTTRALSPSDVPTSAQYRTVLVVSTLLAQLDAHNTTAVDNTIDVDNTIAVDSTSNAQTSWPHLRSLFAALAAQQQRSLLATLTAYHATPLLALLVDHVWREDSALFLGALEDLLRTYRDHVPFAAQCSALIDRKLRTLTLPNLDCLVRYQHVTALIVRGLLRQYHTHPDSLNHVLQNARTLPLLRQYFFAEISPLDRATMTSLAAEVAGEFIALARDSQHATALDSALQWLYGLFLEPVPPSSTCLITCWSRDHWPLYCTLGALIRQQRARDHPACELFRESVHHVLLNSTAQLVPLVSSHVTVALQHDALDLQHVTELLALVETLCGHGAQRQVIDAVTRETANCQHVSSVKFAALVDRLRGTDSEHVAAVASLTRVKHAQLWRDATLNEHEAKAIFSSLLADVMFSAASVHEQMASQLIGLITKYGSLQPWMELEFFNHVVPNHLPRPSADQYRESLPKKSPFEYDQHVIHLVTHRPHVFRVLAALAAPTMASVGKEFLGSALAVLTGMWHSLSLPNSTVPQLEHVTGDLIVSLQSANMLPTLPLQLLALSKLSSSELTSFLHSMWLYLSDKDKSKLAAKCNLLIVDNPRLCVLSVLGEM